MNDHYCTNDLSQELKNIDLIKHVRMQTLREHSKIKSQVVRSSTVYQFFLIRTSIIFRKFSKIMNRINNRIGVLREFYDFLKINCHFR